MFLLLKSVYWYLAAIFMISHNTAMENVMLRHQLAIVTYKRERFSFSKFHKLFWVLCSKIHPLWDKCLVVASPDTVVGWSHNLMKWFWKFRSKTPGRIKIPRDVRYLIKQMRSENIEWGAPKIWEELTRLGIDISLSTVQNYLKHFGPGKNFKSLKKEWKAFLHNHLSVSHSMDFFVIPTISFTYLYVFIILSHDKRKIFHWNITRVPTQKWTYLQIINAYPFNEGTPQYMFHDRDPVFSEEIRDLMNGMRISSHRSAPKSPWQNPYCERVIGTIKREFLNHVIIFGEDHLRKIMTEAVDYYNNFRPHLSLNGNSPDPRKVFSADDGKIVSIPKFGGLHHYYKRVAA